MQDNGIPFRPGEIINATITGARVVATGDDAPFGRFLRIALEVDGRMVDGRLPLDADGVTIERDYPAEWPPQPGDLWREVDGALWFAQSLGGSQMTLVPATVRGSLDCSLPAYVAEVFGPLALVHREDRS